LTWAACSNAGGLFIDRNRQGVTFSVKAKLDARAEAKIGERRFWPVKVGSIDIDSLDCVDGPNSTASECQGVGAPMSPQ
jgi:hypothetical protein